MRKIRISNGLYAKVDDDLYPYLSQFNWTAKQVGRTDKYYAVRREGDRQVFMHREVMNAPEGIDVDHKNNNGLHNTRKNLRLATPSENLRNRGKPSNNSTGYKGVSRQRGRRKFRALIHVNGKKIHLGWFEDPREAALVYDRAVRKYHGKFGCTNF